MYLSYGIVVFVIMHMVKTRKDVEYFIWPLWVMVLFLSVISLSQFLGGPQFAEHPRFGPIQDIFRYDWMQKLLLTRELREVTDTIRIGGRDGFIYGTMYNSNFVGSFGVMMVFLGVAYFFFVQTWWKKLGMGMFVLLMIIIMVGSGSRAGYMGFLSGMTLFVILLIPRLFHLKPVYVLVLIVFIGSGLWTVNTVTEGRFLNRAFSILDFPERNERPQI